MTDFNSLDELAKYINNKKSQVLDLVEKDYFNAKCPTCEAEKKVKNLRNHKNEVECTECGTKFEVTNLEIN